MVIFANKYLRSVFFSRFIFGKSKMFTERLRCALNGKYSHTHRMARIFGLLNFALFIAYFSGYI